MTEFLEYPSMSCEIRGAMKGGQLKLTDDKVIFNQSKSGKKEAIKASDMELVNWQRIAGVWGLRIFTKDGNLHRFAGFKEAERDRVAKHFSSAYSMDMLDKELSVKGWNWGTANFKGSVLSFEVGKHDAFDIPLSYVTQCTNAKSEVTLEFSQNDDAPVNLSEMRFHIPISELAGETDPAETFRDNVTDKANIGTTNTGNDIGSFKEISSLSPRGRYDIRLFPTFIHLHGKTFDYKIPFQTIIRLFLLPHKDQRQMFFCVNLDPPIKQGQTRYHYLVLSFMQEDEYELELDLTDEDLKEKYEGKLEKSMKGPTFELVSRLMKVLSGRKITVPGQFVGHSGTPAVACSFKAASGFVYPLERGFIFVYKPPIFIKYDDIKHVNFARSGGSNRSFDIEVHTRGETSYTFSSIDKEEYGKMYDFLKSKKINVKSTGKMDASKIQLEDDIDHNLAKVKADAASSESDASMSSDDEEFNPDNLEAKEAKEEYDSDPSDTGSDTDEVFSGSEGEQEKKRAEKAERKAKKAERKKTSKPSGGGGGGGTRSKRKKMTKLPGQPKKPMSAYFMWLQEEGRAKIKEDSPGLSVTEVAKKSGEVWKEMKEAEKKGWEDKQKEAKEKYDEEYKEWLEGGGAEAIKKAKKEEKAAAKAGKNSEASPAKKKTAAPKSKAKASSGGGGGGMKVKSAEFIEDSDSDSDNGKEDAKKSSDKSDAEIDSASDKSD